MGLKSILNSLTDACLQCYLEVVRTSTSFVGYRLRLIAWGSFMLVLLSTWREGLRVIRAQAVGLLRSSVPVESSGVKQCVPMTVHEERFTVDVNVGDIHHERA